MKIVFAEMPEAEGRDLAIERRELPPGARIVTYTHRGDAAALAAACRGAQAILTDYVPFDRAMLGRLDGCRIISVAATGWDCVDAAAAAERKRIETDPLSEREREVLRLLALGHTNHEIAASLFISVRTAETHRAHVMQKLGLRTRSELVRYALEHGMLIAA